MDLDGHQGNTRGAARVRLLLGIQKTLMVH